MKKLLSNKFTPIIRKRSLFFIPHSLFIIPYSLFNRIFFWRGISRRNKMASVLFVVILIIFSSLYIYNALKPQSTEAAWFNDNWGYRQMVAITNSGSNQTDYQIAITLDTATLITAGKMRSDCNDIRITDINGNDIYACCYSFDKMEYAQNYV